MLREVIKWDFTCLFSEYNFIFIRVLGTLLLYQLFIENQQESYMLIQLYFETQISYHKINLLVIKCNLYSSRNVTVMESKRLRWAVNAAFMEDGRISDKIRILFTSRVFVISHVGLCSMKFV
jgi:hypothetical protein